MREAEHFANLNDAYIHAEMKNGKNCEIILSGDGLGIIHAVGGIIERLATLQRSSFDETIRAIITMHDESIRQG